LVSFDKVFQQLEKEYITLILELSQMELKWVQYFDYLRSNNNKIMKLGKFTFFLIFQIICMTLRNTQMTWFFKNVESE
jgi:hypothetical protein